MLEDAGLDGAAQLDTGEPGLVSPSDAGNGLGERWSDC